MTIDSTPSRPERPAGDDRLRCGIVSIHDVHPSREAGSSELLDMVDRRSIKATLLVVPGRWNDQSLDDAPAFVHWLHAATGRGHEIAMHGWTHEVSPDRAAAARNPRNRLVARGCAEFVDLDEAGALGRLEAGLWAMADHGFAPVGFTPPGWLASAGTFAALRRLGFEYSTSHGSVHDLVRGERVRIPAVCQRPGSTVAPVGVSIVRRYVVHRVVRHRPVRLALHPADLDHAALRDATEQLLDIVACAPTRTYADLVTTLLRPVDPARVV